MANDISVYKMINDLSKDLGFDDEKTVIEVKSTDNQDIKQLSLKSGSWDSEEPWFVVDENQKLHTMISLKSINQIIQNYKETMEENFQLKLEKAIWKSIPIDFQDVWVVAMDEIKKMATSQNKETRNLNVDLEALIKKIKTKHPNLFLDLKDLNVLGM
ncbi:DUF2603 domain-containing protein [Sulfurospirillum sp. 1307]